MKLNMVGIITKFLNLFFKVDDALENGEGAEIDGFDTSEIERNVAFLIVSDIV